MGLALVSLLLKRYLRVEWPMNTTVEVPSLYVLNLYNANTKASNLITAKFFYASFNIFLTQQITYGLLSSFGLEQP